MPETTFDFAQYAEQNLEDLTQDVNVREGCTVTISHLPPKVWRKLRKDLRKVKGADSFVDQVAESRYYGQLAKAITSWKGMTPQVVTELAPVKADGLPKELPYTPGNAKALLMHSRELHDLVSQAVDDLQSFRDQQKEAELGN